MNQGNQTSRHTCTSCHQPITNGHAVIRTVLFDQVAWHKLCWAARNAVEQAAAA